MHRQLPGDPNSSQGHKDAYTPLHIHAHCWHPKAPSRPLSFPKLSPFRKFSFLSPLKTSINFPSRGEADTTPSLGLLNMFKSLFVAVTEKPRGRLGAPSATQPASQPPGRGPPRQLFLRKSRAEGAPQALMHLALRDHGGVAKGSQLGLAGQGQSPPSRPPASHALNPTSNIAVKRKYAPTLSQTP